jgi:UPF0716 protein FxsA
MMARLLALFIGVPLVEMVLLIQLGQLVGLWPTLGLIVVTGMLGAALARHEGTRVWREVQRELQAGRMPAASLVDGLLILIAGAVLLTPGLLTDAAGFFLLVPAGRRVIRRAVSSRMRVHTAGFGVPPPRSTVRPTDDTVIEGEWERVDD